MVVAVEDTLDGGAMGDDWETYNCTLSNGDGWSTIRQDWVAEKLGIKCEDGLNTVDTPAHEQQPGDNLMTFCVPDCSARGYVDPKKDGTTYCPGWCTMTQNSRGYYYEPRDTACRAVKPESGYFKEHCQAGPDGKVHSKLWFYLHDKYDEMH